jgi:hypothetical protein
MRLLRRRSAEAVARLERYRAFKDINERLGAYKDGLVFRCEIQMGAFKPRVVVKELHGNDNRLLYSSLVANIVQQHRRVLVVVSQCRRMKYVIY